MSGLHHQIDKQYSKWNPASVKRLMRQMNSMCTILKNDMTLFRGTWNTFPMMSKSTSMPHANSQLPTTIHVKHPMSTSTQRSIATEFSNKGCCLHVINVSPGVAVLSSVVLYSNCNEAAKRECEYIILPPVVMIYIKSSGANMFWRCVPPRQNT
jgi:hypothetical protein